MMFRRTTMLLVLASTMLPTVRADDVSEPRAAKPAIGTSVPDLSVIDIRGLKRRLSEIGESKATVLIFTTTTCPLVRRSFPKLVDLHARFRERNVTFVAVNVGADDTIRDMAKQALDFEIPFYFVKDGDLSCSKALGVTRTPEAIVLDDSRTIRYRGRIDDQLRIGGTRPVASRADLEIAIGEVLSDQQVSIAETDSDGCEITVPASRPRMAGLTWSTHVRPIIEKRCVNCHREGTAAPFPLLTYEDVSANAEMIRVVVETETMPPWYAATSKIHFQNDTSLTVSEKDTVLDWIASGKKLGEPAQIIQEARSASDWRIGEPDVVITMVEEHEVPATGFVPYKYTVLPYLFFNETWVEAFEIKPDNPSVVHHCNMAYVTRDGAGEQTFITGYVPGGQPMDLGHFDNGAAVRIPAGAGLGLQIHYTTTGKEERCRIQVGIRFPRRTVRKQVRHFLLDPRGWRITPFDPAFRIEAKHELDRDANLLGMFTHMHVRGRDMSFFADHRDGRSESLLQIPNYNFEWQLGYELKPGDQLIPRGTVIRAVAHFDNSKFNPYNPDPGASVGYGPQTVDEMFNGFVFYVDQHEDLNLTVDEKTGRAPQ
ncbi:MAG: redoxin family protein [Planctomycetota bacterium]